MAQKQSEDLYIKKIQATKDSILEKFDGPLLVLLLELGSGMNTWQNIRKMAGAD
jgi:hypothetical protein